MLRCIICDYTPEEGSDYADLPPGIFRMHSKDGDYLCDECLQVSEENLSDLSLEDEDEVQE